MKVRCTDNSGIEQLTLNKIYFIIKENPTHYSLVDDNNITWYYAKTRFKAILEPIKLHNRKQLISLLNIERSRQNDKFGFPQNNTLAEWGIILGEEFGEVMWEINKSYYNKINTENLKTELIQVAAVCFNILEHMEDK